MKKFVSLILTLCLTMSLSAGAFASGEASGSGEVSVNRTTGDWKYTRTEKDGAYTVSITQFSGDPDASGVVVVPAILGGGAVTAIGMTAFRDTSIKTVLLPDTVDAVSQWAFYDCTALTSVTCANAGVSVDPAAFQNSPASVTAQGQTADITIAETDLTGFDLLVAGTYILPAGYTWALTPETDAILRPDAKGTVTANGTAWTVEGYDVSGVDLDGDAAAELVIADNLASFGLKASEVNKTFRALSAAEAEELNAEVASGAFAAYASRLRFEEGFYLGGSPVAVDDALVCYDAATGDIIVQFTRAADVYDNPVVNALGVKNRSNPYNYVAWRDTDGDGDIDALFYADRTLEAGGATIALSGALKYEGVTGQKNSPELAGKVGRPVLDGAYLSFENAAIEAGSGEMVELASAELTTADDSVMGRINEERSLLWADGDGEINIGKLNGVSTSEGNWTKLRDENNSYAGQPMEVIMQWGVGAVMYASQGGIIRVGDPMGERSSVYACGDGANGVLATGILDADRPSQIYIYNTDFTLEGWNNHVVDTIYGGYVYLNDVYGETGKAGSYIMNNGSTLANDFGDGTVETDGFTGVAWGDSSAGMYAIGNGSLRSVDTSLTSHLNAAIKALGGVIIMKDSDLTGMNCFSGSGSVAEFDGGTWTLIRDYEGDGYVYGKAAAEIAQLWYDITGGTTLLSYIMSGVGNTYSDLYAEYKDAIDAWGGKDKFYAAVDAIADTYGYGTAYHAADDALLRDSMFDNTYYAIMRNGFQYAPVDGKYSLDALADWSDVPYLGASNLKNFQVSIFDASGAVDVKNVTFAYDDSIGEDYRFFSTGKGVVNLTDCTGASGIITAGTANFTGTDFSGSFAAGNKGLWDGPVGYIDGNGEYTFRNGNYTGAEAPGAAASFTGCTWTVTHESYLSALTIGADAAIVGENGAAVTMTVNGVATPIGPGSYEGDIVLTLAQ